MIHSDWHIHTDASYDAHLPLEVLIREAKKQGLRSFGVTDHLNFNDEKFMGDLRKSAGNFKRLAPSCPEMVLGVELTPIAKPEFDYIAKTGTREGYVPVPQDTPYAMELGATKEELMALGVRYAVGAAHWRIDVADVKAVDNGLEANIREWHRLQLALACDPRVTILGHPWSCNASWREDFSLIPRSMHDELAAALKENGKYIENNASMQNDPAYSEKFRCQYAEFMREMFERGVPVTYGSDCHGGGAGRREYPDKRPGCDPYLAAAGFREGDFSELTEKDFW